MGADTIDGLARVGTIAQRLHRRNAGRAGLPSLIAVTDRRRGIDPFDTAERLRPGQALLLRDYDWADRAEAARTLSRICRARGIALIVAGDARLAVAVRAWGLHLPEGLAIAHGGMNAALARRAGLRLTVAAHGAAALGRAAALGADAALLSPVFATESHPGAPSLGAVRFEALARQTPLPVYALGGIGGRMAQRLAGSCAAGLAGIGFLG